VQGVRDKAVASGVVVSPAELGHCGFEEDAGEDRQVTRSTSEHVDTALRAASERNYGVVP
jgi:hypothetical protein